MDHKPDLAEQYAKMAGLMAQLQQALHQIRTTLNLSPELQAIVARAEAEARRTLSQRVARSGGLMSGRWHRRDGDVYGIVRQPGVRLPEAPNGRRE